MKDYDKNVFLLCKKWMESVRTVTDVTGTIGAWRLLSSSLKTHQHSHVKETIYPSKWAVAVQEDIVKSIKNEYVSGENTRQVLEEITDNVYISVQTVKIPRNSGFDPTENNVTSSQYGRHIEEEIGRLLMYDQMMDCRLEAVHDSVFGDFLVSIFKLLCQRGILLVAKKMNITKEFDFPEPAKRRRGLDDAFTRPESFVINGQLDFMAYNVCTGRWCIIDSKYSTSPLPVSLSWAFQLFLYSCTVSKKYDLDYLPDGYVIYVNPTKHTISLLRVNYSWVLKTEHMLTEENRRILSSMYSSHYTKSNTKLSDITYTNTKSNTKSTNSKKPTANTNNSKQKARQQHKTHSKHRQQHQVKHKSHQQHKSHRKHRQQQTKRPPTANITQQTLTKKPSQTQSPQQTSRPHKKIELKMEKWSQIET